jgi:hypothetical protein
MDDTTIKVAIQRTDMIAGRVRSQFFARLAFPWRFEAYPLGALTEAPRDADREAWIDELDFHCLLTLERDAEP